MHANHTIIVVHSTTQPTYSMQLMYIPLDTNVKLIGSDSKDFLTQNLS